MTALIDITNIRIETERLLLRPMRETDAEDFHEIVSDPEIADQAGFTCRHSLEESKGYLNQMIRSGDILGVTLKEQGKLVGIFALRGRDWEGYPISPTLLGRECGFELNRDYWGRGLIPEALRAMNRYCFETLGYDFVTAGHFLRNTRSAHIIQKCGFAFLFEHDFTMPDGKQEPVRTYICCNPNKEIPNV